MKILVLFSVLLALTSSTFLPADQHVAIIGTGYVGLVVGACLADMGNTVICVDKDARKIELLNEGKIPIYEPGLKELVATTTVRGTLSFTSDLEEAIHKSEIIIIAVGTPMNEKGLADLTDIESVAKSIGEHLNSYKVIVTKSTVPIGTGKLIHKIVEEASHGLYPFDIVSNPEFLREGSSIKDFMEPHRIVVGVESEKANEIINRLYQPLTAKGVPLLHTSIVTAETIKYASNSFLAVKISFINEISNLCDITGADVTLVSKGMGLDHRIGKDFLNPGPGFGGSCFPKDIQALLHKGESEGITLKLLKAALEANDEQRIRIVAKLSTLLDGEFEGKKIAILGLAFKANTDDIRCSPAQAIIGLLLENNANVTAYDPVAMEHMKKLYPEIEYASTLYDAIEGADAILVLTEWNEFKTMDLNRIKTMVKQPFIVDARNILNTRKLHELGFTFLNVGNAKIEGTLCTK